MDNLNDGDNMIAGKDLYLIALPSTLESARMIKFVGELIHLQDYLYKSAYKFLLIQPQKVLYRTT